MSTTTAAKMTEGHTYNIRIVENGTDRVLTQTTATVALKGSGSDNTAGALRAWMMRWTKRTARYDCRAEIEEAVR